jgi:type IV secretory pathway VirB10-like protein
MPRIALLVVAFLAASSAQAQVHKCVDAAGKIIYTQDPCPANTKSGTMSRNVLSAPAAPSAAPPADSPVDKAAAAPKSTAPKTAAEQEQAFRQRQQEQAKASKQAEQKSAEAQAKEQNCRSARERLAQYDIGGRLSRITPEGERYYMDDAQIEQEKSRARAGIAQACN